MAGWNGFWDRKGVIAVTALDFLVVLLGEGLLAGAGLPVFQLPGHPSFGPPSLSLPAMLAAGQGLYPLLAGFLLLFVLTPFMAAATPSSLLDALNGEFSVIGYCEKGVRYFWRALAFLLFYLVVIAIGGTLSAILFYLLARAARALGGLLAVILLIAPWIFIGEVLIIALVRYLTSREYGLWTCLARSISFVREKYLPLLGLVIIIAIFSLLGTAVVFILNLIPVAGFIIGLFVSSAINVIGLLAIMTFAGVA